MKYICSICGYVYDEAKEKIPFSQLPESWKCPWCKAPKSMFRPEEKKEEPAPVPAPVPAQMDDEGEASLSWGEFAALCSNLGRGCEKQYHQEEAELFYQLADYFAAVTPRQENASLEQLAKLIEKDREKGYKAVKAAADLAGDRGTKRICVWGEKVTNMLGTLIGQYQEEGEAFLSGTNIWVCTICGFIYVGDKAPEICPVCKVPEWKFEKIEGRADA